MYVKVRSMDGTQTVVLNISKTTSVEDFRLLVQDKYDVPPERQRLFFRGKQMEDGHRIFDYSVNINDVIQLMVKPILNELTNQNNEKGSKGKSSTSKQPVSNKENVVEVESKEATLNVNASLKSQYYEVGDLVDAKSLYDGAWWEGKITKMGPNLRCKEKTETDDGLFYYIKFERYPDVPEDELKLEHIRPRARIKIPIKDLKTKEMVMVNYNFENPEERGFWYDCEVTKVINTKSQKTLIGTLITNGNNRVDGCHINLVSEIFKVESHVPLNERNGLSSVKEDTPTKRISGPSCKTCKDNPKRKCKDCGCSKCHGKENPEKQLMCDECDQPYHIYCLDPPLEAIPEVDEWYCPECKNDDNEIVKAGEKLKESKKKAKLASSKNPTTSRDWGKGFACAGRQRVCTIVPQDHFGPIPGVEVGTLWKFRLQVSEAGIHRPHVAGIHGTEKKGAYSIVLAGGYEDDEDRGEEFTYTGSGGRDLSGNKRTAEQSCDQLLTRMNKALALNCNSPLNKDGGEAKDWKKGKPVRVVRNYKGRKHSEYAPEEGNRYDGIYKIVKYWQSAGKSGFKVWRYLLRRDDPNPPPWSREGMKKCKELGLMMQYPDGYLDAMKEKEKSSMNSTSSSGDETTMEEEEKEKPKKRGRKRKNPSEDEEKSPSVKKASKKTKSTIEYKLESEIIGHINDDKINEKIWEECKTSLTDGKSAFLSVVEERFLCACCQILVNEPITTPCKHNVCHSCLQRSFKAELYSCPSCRYDLGRKFDMELNSHLMQVLKFLFPGYDAGR